VRSSIALFVTLAGLAGATAARAEGGLRKGPWLMDLRADSIVVMAEREEAGPLHVSARPLGAPGEGDGAVRGLPATVEVDAPADATLHELTLPGLAPGMRYAYTVTGRGVTAAEGSFCTPPRVASPFRFAIYGDTRTQRLRHAEVVRGMMREGAEFVIHTGDLVSDGRDEDDWQDFFDAATPLLRNVPLVPVIGNHEMQSRLRSGEGNYRRYVHLDESGPSPELDAVVRYGDVRVVLTSSYDDWSGPSRDWLDRELAKARREVPAGWIFVVMHEGPRSSGPHGDNEELRELGVERLLRRHRVDLVISGHDHAYERGEDDGLRYLVSGGGGAPLYQRRRVRSSTLSFASDHHFVRADVGREEVKFTAMRPDGTVIDTGVLRRDGWADAPRAAARPSVAAPREAPVAAGPFADWKAIARFAPLFALVTAGAWWARRRAQRG
jgi:predicted phosphodiesterase